jgi:hypothetical protein
MIDLIYTAANNGRLLALCERANWLPGIRSDKHPSPKASPIHFIDVKYTAPNFVRHLALVRQLHPRFATVPDLSAQEVSREDVRRALLQAEALAPYCEAVLVVPKLPGQIAMLPKETVIGYSIPTRYGGASYPVWELEGREIHLLGGSPQQQLLLYSYLSCFATITSADGNMFQKMSGYGKFWQAGRWVRHPAAGLGESSVSYDCVYRSLVNIRQAWLSFFQYARCPSCGDGLGLSLRCSFCQGARRSGPTVLHSF